MTPEDVQTGGELLDSLAGGTTKADGTAKTDAGEAATRTALKTNYTTTDERSDKHELMLNNFSGDGIKMTVATMHRLLRSLCHWGNSSRSHGRTCSRPAYRRGLI